MEFEKELARIVQQYHDEGYAVVTYPRDDQLDGFSTFGADILATRGNEKVLVQVKPTRAEVEADPSIPRRAEEVNARPGWRYDLVVLSEGDPVRRITRGSREPSNEEIDQTLVEVERLVETSHVRAAFVMAWSAFEAAMRQVASDVELYMPKTTPIELLRTLYGNGILSREEFARLNASYRVRTEIVHGLVSSPIDPDLIRGVVAETRRLLTGNANALSVAN